MLLKGKNVYQSKLNLQEQLQLSIVGFVSYLLQLSNLQIMNTYYSYPLTDNWQLKKKLIMTYNLTKSTTMYTKSIVCSINRLKEPRA